MSTIRSRPLIILLRRLATQLRAGVDARTAWGKAAETNSGVLQQKLTQIDRRLSAGDTTTEAVRSCGDFFPPFVRDMIEVGDSAGRMEAVLERVAEHYEHQLAVRRKFLSMITLPAIQFAMAVLVIAILIIALGYLTDSSSPQAMTVFGLRGVTGAIQFLSCVAIVIGGVGLAAYGLLSGWFGPRPLMIAMRLPVIGQYLRHSALSRMAWTMSATLNSGLDARRAMALALQSTQNYVFNTAAEPVDQAIERNESLADALRSAHVFPNEFTDALAAAELSGTQTESLDFLARDYQQRSDTAAKALAVTAGTTMTILMAGMIVFAIFYLFMQYVNMIQGALDSL